MKKKKKMHIQNIAFRRKINNKYFQMKIRT